MPIQPQSEEALSLQLEMFFGCLDPWHFTFLGSEHDVPEVQARILVHTFSLLQALESAFICSTFECSQHLPALPFFFPLFGLTLDPQVLTRVLALVLVLPLALLCFHLIHIGGHLLNLFLKGPSPLCGLCLDFRTLDGSSNLQKSAIDMTPYFEYLNLVLDTT